MPFVDTPNLKVRPLVGGIRGELHHLRDGQSVVMPGGVRPSARAITACTMRDVFQPPRDDHR